MKRILACLALCALYILGSSVHAGDRGKKKGLERLGWLPGTWEMKTAQGVFTEHWEPMTEDVWKGKGVFVTYKGDTVFAEQLQLVNDHDTLWYMAATKRQNEGLPVGFKELSFNEGKIVFENAKHDFPQRIIYTRTSDSTMEAVVEGNQEGKDRKETFSFIKKK